MAGKKAKRAAKKPRSSPRDPVSDGLPLMAPDDIEQDFPDELDNVVPTHGYQMLPMVGLGGSAGSIPALQKFLTATPSDSGLVFVVIVHLSAEHESVLPDILQRSTKMKVVPPRYEIPGAKSSDTSNV